MENLSKIKIIVIKKKKKREAVWTVGMQWDDVEANLCSHVNKTDL